MDNKLRADKEREEIYGEPYRATQAEVNNFTPEQFRRWRDLGGHLAKTPEEEAEQKRKADFKINRMGKLCYIMRSYPRRISPRSP